MRREEKPLVTTPTASVYERQLLARMALEQGPGIVDCIGEETLVIITRSGKAPRYLERSGNMSPTACKTAGLLACQTVCQLPEGVRNADDCADQNVGRALAAYGLDNRRTVEIVPHTGKLPVEQQAYHTGFADRFRFYERHGLLSQGPAGQHVLQNFNVCFVPADTYDAIFCRSTMSAMQLGFELHGQDGRAIIGLLSMSMQSFPRPHVFQANGVPGKLYSPVSHALLMAQRHYGLDPARVYMHLFAAPPEVKRMFSSEDDRERRFPGWYGDGLMYNQAVTTAHGCSEKFVCRGWRLRLRAAMLSNIAQALYDLDIPGEYIHVSLPEEAQLFARKNEFSRGDPEKDKAVQDLYIIRHAGNP